MEFPLGDFYRVKGFAALWLRASGTGENQPTRGRPLCSFGDQFAPRSRRALSGSSVTAGRRATVGAAISGALALNGYALRVYRNGGRPLNREYR